MVADSGGPRMKLSAGKITLPGCKQVWRYEREGVIDHDVIALENETIPGARPILLPVMSNGQRVTEPATLDEIRKRCASTLETLPKSLKSLTQRAEYQVERSERLRDLVERTSATRR